MMPYSQNFRAKVLSMCDSDVGPKRWVEQHLVPLLKPDDIVVMDNLSSHKVRGVRESIEQA